MGTVSGVSASSDPQPGLRDLYPLKALRVIPRRSGIWGPVTWTTQEWVTVPPPNHVCLWGLELVRPAHGSVPSRLDAACAIRALSAGQFPLAAVCRGHPPNQAGLPQPPVCLACASCSAHPWANPAGALCPVVSAHNRPEEMRRRCRGECLGARAARRCSLCPGWMPTLTLQ